MVLSSSKAIKKSHKKIKVLPSSESEEEELNNEEVIITKPKNEKNLKIQLKLNAFKFYVFLERIYKQLCGMAD